MVSAHSPSKPSTATRSYPRENGRAPGRSTVCSHRPSIGPPLRTASHRGSVINICGPPTGPGQAFPNSSKTIRSSETPLATKAFIDPSTISGDPQR